MGQLQSTYSSNESRLREKRQRRRRRSGLLALLGCMVTIATALAFMLPAISITKDVAEQEQGIDLPAAEVEVLADGASGSTGEASTVDEASEQTSDASSQDAEEADQSSEGDAGSNGYGSSNGDGGSDDGSSVEADPGNDGADGEDGAAEAGASPENNDSSAESTAGDAGAENESESGAVVPDGGVSSDESADPVEPDVSAQNAGAEARMPAQAFKHEFKNRKGEVTLAVLVDAPEGALPEGAAMEVKEVKSDEVAGAVDEAARKEGAGSVGRMTAVDITFKDAAGNEVEPAKDVTVTMACDLVKPDADLLVVHVDDDGRPDVVKPLTKRPAI